MSAPAVALLLTMDCERVRQSEFYPAGPESWRESERNISAFTESVEEYGFKATFFAVPEAAAAHRALFRQLIDRGHEVGLHLHPHTFRYGVNEYLGNLPSETQRTLVDDASGAFEAALGFRPTSFRPGHFSATIETLKVLATSGFRRGSFGIPGRFRFGTGSDWRGWPKDCRYVEGLFEAPVTTCELPTVTRLRFRAGYAARLAARGAWLDAVRVARRAVGHTDVADLRLEAGDSGLSAAIVRAEVGRMRRDGGMPVITALTHSYINFSNERGVGEHGLPRRGQLRRLLMTLTSWRDCAFEPQTLIGLQRAFDAQRSPDWDARQAVSGSVRANSFSHSLRS